jgi:hypothetical protein
MLPSVEAMYAKVIEEQMKSNDKLFEFMTNFPQELKYAPEFGSVRVEAKLALEKYFEEFEFSVMAGYYCRDSTPAIVHDEKSVPFQRFLALPPWLASQLLRSDKLRVSSENAIFVAADQYLTRLAASGKYNKHEIASISEDIYKAVRYNLVHPAVLSDFVLTRPAILESPSLVVRGLG